MARPHFALMSLLLASSVSLSVFAFSLPARAQSEDAAQTCQQPITSVETSLAACTAAIDSSDRDGAVADFQQAVKLSPQFKEAVERLQELGVKM
ncbi:hypothetical protein LRC39_12635 [Rhodopseudomonas sp. P1]|uniref:hypothetical protein n=1 Tax=Rhodopseudomonas sp. P1 TaxID=3434357 RepID=UPI0031FCA39F